jgi:hypothetical protein
MCRKTIKLGAVQEESESEKGEMKNGKKTTNGEIRRENVVH